MSKLTKPEKKLLTKHFKDLVEFLDSQDGKHIMMAYREEINSKSLKLLTKDEVQIVLLLKILYRFLSKEK